MIKRTIILIVIIHLNLLGNSQSLRDSTTLPNTQLRLALQLIADGKDCANTLKLTENQVALLEKQVDLKDSIISNKDEIINTKTIIIDTYKLEVNSLDYQNDIYIKSNKKLTRQLKTSKTKTFLVALVGIIATSYLLLK